MFYLLLTYKLRNVLASLIQLNYLRISIIVDICPLLPPAQIRSVLRFLLGAVALHESPLPSSPGDLQAEALPLLDRYMLHLLKEHIDKVLQAP